MANPRLYFTINEGIFFPYRGQNTILDVKYKNNPILIGICKGLLSDKLKEFILRNGKKNIILWSEDYGYDHNTCAFEFPTVLRVANDNDLTSLFTDKCEFDPTVDYKTGGEIEEVKVVEDENGNKHVVKQTKFISTLPSCPSIDGTGFYVEDANWKYLIRNIKRNKPTLLIGPTGTGKTELVMMACKQLGISCEIHDMGSMQDPLTDLIGTHRIKDGSSTFDYAKFVDDVQKPGVILLDELSRAPLMTNNILFPCLDSRRELPLAIADSEGPRCVKVHPECVFIATANIGSEYAGTNDIDAALLNRFLPLKVEYIPMNYEIDVLINRTGIDRELAAPIVRFANIMRSKNAEGVVEFPVSTRENIAIAELIVDGFSIADAIDFVICNKFNNETVKPVKQIMMTL